MKKKRKIMLTILITVAVIMLVILGAKTYIESNLDQLSDLAIANVDLSKVPDGLYSGSYKVFPVEAEVKVAVKENKIMGIELIKHLNGQGSAAEVIPEKVVEAQTLQVDFVSGATYSSKVILKAIENALIKGK